MNLLTLKLLADNPYRPRTAEEYRVFLNEIYKAVAAEISQDIWQGVVDETCQLVSRYSIDHPQSFKCLFSASQYEGWFFLEFHPVTGLRISIQVFA